MNKFKGNLQIVSALTYRNLKIFLKDKANVFFSMLAPLIVLLLYVLFLKKMQLDGIMSTFENIYHYNDVNKKMVEGFLDGWLISGMLSIGCITVSLSANTVRVSDKSRGIVNDIIVSPVRQSLVKISYFTFNFLVTIIIMTMVFFVSLIYLAAMGTWYISVGNVFAIYGTLIFSTISATFFTSFVTDFCKSEATLSALVGITSAMIGFIMGAYVPLAQLPTGVQYVAAILPGTHSAGMMREFLMTAPLNELVNSLPSAFPKSEIFDSLSNAYCLELNFFGIDISSGYMALYIGCTTLLLFALNMIIHGKKPLAGEGKSLFKKKSKN